VNPDLRWYVVHAYSGMEKAVERNIRERIMRAGMEDAFGEILVPTEEVVEIKNGRRRRPSGASTLGMCWCRW
jgi:transcriptional antiterminator NusG